MEGVVFVLSLEDGEVLFIFLKKENTGNRIKTLSIRLH